MFYRILTAPPGYASHQKYMVAKYTTSQFGSCCRGIENEDGSKFFATLDAARKAIPTDARQLPFEPEDQFIELWQSPIEAGNSERVRIPKDVAAEVDRLIREGLIISAIKQLRALGLGLKSSKEYVDTRLERIARPKAPCPYCEKFLKSAKAKQCFECGMDWHDPHNIRRLGYHANSEMELHFFRDASNRLTHDRMDIDSADYPEICRKVADRFNLKPSSDVVVGFDQMFWDFTDGTLTVELAWEIWFGFMVTAKEAAAEPLVCRIAAFLCESLPRKLSE